MNEIKRLQQLAGIITEIRVNKPNTKGLSMEDFLIYRSMVEDEFENYREEMPEQDQEDYNIYLDQVENANTIKELDDALLWLYANDQVQVDDTKAAILKGLNEIKVNTPNKKIQTPEGNEGIIIKKSTYEDNKELIDREIQEQGYDNDPSIVSWYLLKLDNGETQWWDEDELLNYNDNLNEDVSDFNIGQSSETGGRRTTVTDVDPETQSVTWSVKKEVDDSTIHKDITDLINKFEKVQLKDFHSRPKLIQLVKDLKSIRNKFSRTVVKEDKQRLEKTLRGILNEIKVNKPVNRLEDIEEILKGKMLLLAGLFRKYFNGWSMGEKSHESKTYYNKLSYEDKLNMYQDAIRLSKGETI